MDFWLTVIKELNMAKWPPDVTICLNNIKTSLMIQWLWCFIFWGPLGANFPPWSPLLILINVGLLQWTTQPLFKQLIEVSTFHEKIGAQNTNEKRKNSIPSYWQKQCNTELCESIRLQVDHMWTHTQNYVSHWPLIEHLDLLEQTIILIAVFKKSLPPSCNSANSRKHFDFLPWHLVAVIIYVNLNWMTVSEGGLTSLKSAVRLGSPTSCADPQYTSFCWMIYILLCLACILSSQNAWLFIEMAMTCRETWKWYLLSTWTRWSKPKKGSLRYTALEKGILWLKEG